MGGKGPIKNTRFLNSQLYQLQKKFLDQLIQTEKPRRHLDTYRTEKMNLVDRGAGSSGHAGPRNTGDGAAVAPMAARASDAGTVDHAWSLLTLPTLPGSWGPGSSTPVAL